MNSMNLVKYNAARKALVVLDEEDR